MPQLLSLHRRGVWQPGGGALLSPGLRPGGKLVRTHPDGRITLCGPAGGRQPGCRLLVDGLIQRFADTAAAPQQFAGVPAIFLQSPYYEGHAIAYQDGLSTDFLTDLGFVTALSAIPSVQAGKLRPLGVAASERISLLPDVPTLAEQGFPGFSALAWWGIFAPAGTPNPTEMLGKLTLKTWTEDKLDWAHIEQCRAVGVKRFTDALAQVMTRLDGMIPAGANVFFAPVSYTHLTLPTSDLV